MKLYVAVKSKGKKINQSKFKKKLQILVCFEFSIARASHHMSNAVTDVPNEGGDPNRSSMVVTIR